MLGAGTLAALIVGAEGTFKAGDAADAFGSAMAFGLKKSRMDLLDAMVIYAQSRRFKMDCLVPSRTFTDAGVGCDAMLK